MGYTNDASGCSGVNAVNVYDALCGGAAGDPQSFKSRRHVRVVTLLTKHM